MFEELGTKILIWIILVLNDFIFFMNLSITQVLVIKALKRPSHPYYK